MSDERKTAEQERLVYHVSVREEGRTYFEDAVCRLGLQLAYIDFCQSAFSWDVAQGRVTTIAQNAKLSRPHESLGDERKTAEQIAWDLIGDANRAYETKPLRENIARALESYAAERVTEEREACAQTCDKEHFPITHQTGVRSACGAAIRRRGQK